MAPSFCEDCRSNPVHSGFPCFFPIFKKEDVIFIEEGEDLSLRQEIIDNLKEARECLARAERAGLDDHLAVGIEDRIELMILRLEDKEACCEKQDNAAKQA